MTSAFARTPSVARTSAAAPMARRLHSESSRCTGRPGPPLVVGSRKVVPGTDGRLSNATEGPEPAETVSSGPVPRRRPDHRPLTIARSA